MTDKEQQEIDKAVEDMKKRSEVENIKQDANEKKARLDQKKYTQQLDQVKQNEKDLEIAKNADFGAMSEEQILELQKANDEYIEAAKKRMIFIDKEFDEFVPYFRKNFILIGAETGRGKSTVAANIAFTTMQQTNPATGKRCRVLLLTNEEKSEDFYNRITCLSRGWHYTNHSNFTQEQTDTFRKAIPVLARGGRLTVVDNNFQGSHGTTTTIEGIEMIFENLIAKKEWYDVIIIDYYQNIISSKNYIHLTENEVQAKLARMLDRYKNIYPAPIILMCQVNPLSAEDTTPFQQRIKGRKLIMDPSTMAMELTVDYQRRATQFTFWKSRFTKAIGKSVWMGYDDGKFVPETDEFIARVRQENDEREARAVNRQIDKTNGIPDVFKKKEEDGASGTETDGSGNTES